MKRISKWDWAAIVIILIGAAFRIYHLFIFPSNEPFRLGGLFFEFSRQIEQNNFAFPETIPYYSAGGIPFAYPPLSFYLQAFIIRFINPPQFYMVNLIPPLTTILSLPAFYWLIKQYTNDRQIALAGLFSFALLPPAFLNQIEAAGLAESFGMVTLILYLGFIIRWEKQPNWNDTILAGITLGFCILSSPGSAYAATLFSMIIFIWKCIQGLISHKIYPTLMLLLLGCIALLISAPYWLSVMNNHGVDFFITPFLGQHQSDTSPEQLKHIISFQPAGDTLSFIWNWLILAGFFWAVLKRHTQIIGIFLLFWLIPREGIWMVSIPAAILAGIGLINVLLPLFQKAFKYSNGKRPPLAPGILGLILLILVFANTFFKLTVLINEPNWYISRTQIDSLRKFQNDIPEDESSIVLGNIALSEWAPAIMQREVLNIEYSLEWQPDELEKVNLINTAIEDGDFAGMIDSLDAYTEDRQIYLISSSIDLENLQRSPSNNYSLSLIKSTPELNLYILNINEVVED